MISNTFEEMIIELLQGKSDRLRNKLEIEDAQIPQALFNRKVSELTAHVAQTGSLPEHISKALAYDLGLPPNASHEELKAAAAQKRETPDSTIADRFGKLVALLLKL